MTTTTKDTNKVFSNNKQPWNSDHEKLKSSKFLLTKPIVAVPPMKRKHDNYNQDKAQNSVRKTPKTTANLFVSQRNQLLDTNKMQQAFPKPSGENVNLNRKVAQIKPFNMIDDQVIDLTSNKTMSLEESDTKAGNISYTHDKKPLVKCKLEFLTF